MRLKSTLEQWLTLIEIEKAGSIQAASNVLNKSHTTLIYSIKKLESQLDVSLIEQQGRRAVLTPHALHLLRQAKLLIEQADNLEQASSLLAKGWESEISIAMDHLCDKRWLYAPLKTFQEQHPHISVQVHETSMTSTFNVGKNKQMDLAIINMPQVDHHLEVFGTITMLPVVSANHPLAGLSNIGQEDLVTQTQIVLRDLGSAEAEESFDIGWLKSRQRITVDNFDHAWAAIDLGLGFCRLPQHLLEQRNPDSYHVLPWKGNEQYQVPMHLITPKGTHTGPAAQALFDLLLESAKARLA